MDLCLPDYLKDPTWVWILFWPLRIKHSLDKLAQTQVWIIYLNQAWARFLDKKDELGMKICPTLLNILRAQ